MNNFYYIPRAQYAKHPLPYGLEMKQEYTDDDHPITNRRPMGGPADKPTYYEPATAGERGYAISQCPQLPGMTWLLTSVHAQPGLQNNLSLYLEHSNQSNDIGTQKKKQLK